MFNINLKSPQKQIHMYRNTCGTTMHVSYTKNFKFTNIKYLFRIVIFIFKDLGENAQTILSC